MENKSLYILGTRIDKVTFEESTQKAIDILHGKSQHYFTTPNPEITLVAAKDKSYQAILNKSSLNIPDGIGLLYASKFLKAINKTDFIIKERVTGTDLTIKLIQLSKTEGFSIFFLGASKKSSEKVVAYAKKQHANIAGSYTDNLNSKECIATIKKTKPDLLLVAMNFPKQEIWISKNLKALPSVKLSIGIGGAFDFIAEARKRAPRLLRRLGLEWLYRLIQEPRRIKRIFNAVIVFPIKVLLSNKNNTTS
ncbi:MAG: WecB/TagA/CpsF family glycosyltransferase [Candidatus Peregrinibacteria bacterium]|nr:WecB/TagA/CpsF family glycosyltransferase [Candidatus Peregrinibacteria bacterium]MDZ4245255.1 WecB/TagA/CpsF family glycosyltransferase [Candidatus Gracilibacteria bacterium]